MLSHPCFITLGIYSMCWSSIHYCAWKHCTGHSSVPHKKDIVLRSLCVCVLDIPENVPIHMKKNGDVEENSEQSQELLSQTHGKTSTTAKSDDYHCHGYSFSGILTDECSEYLYSCKHCHHLVNRMYPLSSLYIRGI